MTQKIIKKQAINIIELMRKASVDCGDYYHEDENCIRFDGELYKKDMEFLSNEKQENTLDTSKINRVEVIDHTKDLEFGGGRCYVKWQSGIDVSIDIQDDGKTLKIFIK